MTLIAFKVNYDIDYYVSEETKRILEQYFQGFGNIKTAQDLCGFNDFYNHFETYWDSKIVQFYQKKSGIEILIIKPNDSYLTNRITIPKELALKYPLRGDELVDSEDFINEYEPKKFKQDGCNYQWVSNFQNCF